MSHKAELLACDVVTVPPTDSILSVARLMRDKRIGCVVVADEGKVVGVFSERDVVNRVIAEGVDPATPVSEYMTKEPKTVDVADPLEKVFTLLSRRRFRHVIIVKGGKPAGMVSLSDFAGVLREVFSEEKYAQYFVDYRQGGESGPANR